MTVSDNVRRFFGGVGLEDEAYKYAISGNPVHVWRAYLFARTGGHPIPPWVAEYFEQSAKKLEPIFTKKHVEGETVDPREITDALGLTGQAGGGKSPVRQAQARSRRLAMVKTVFALEKMHVDDDTVKRRDVVTWAAEEFSVHESTVWKALKEHEAET